MGAHLLEAELSHEAGQRQCCSNEGTALCQQAIAWYLAWRLWHCLPVVANHATGERSHTSTCPDSPIVDGLGRWPILYDCEKTHIVDLVDE